MSLTLEQKLNIHELLGRAALAYDERDMTTLEAGFAASANMSMRIAGGDLIGPFEGRDAIMKLFTDSMATQTDVRRHVVSNIFFDESGANPVAISNLTLVATENGEIQLLTAGIYRDTMVQENGNWCIANRHIELDKSY
jgi:3-phenylpropionate/cinnamic acid dioxygenase small subunit